MYWANFLHIYQPPTQFPEILAQISQTCYRRIILLLKKYPKSKITLNVNASLTELWVNNHHEDIIESLKDLANKGQIEFTSSAKYHPLLPKLPKTEIIRQILINDETNKKYFGKAYQPRGFFPPEMGYSEKVGEALNELGFEWVIMDESGFPKKNAVKKHNVIYKIENTNLIAVFREQALSLKIAFSDITNREQFWAYIKNRFLPDDYLITAMDGETYGHHLPHQMQLLESLLSDKDLNQVTISEVIGMFPQKIEITPLRSTWGSETEDKEAGTIFPRWENPQNPIHKKQWELTFLAFQAIEKLDTDDQNYEEVRTLMDKAVHSDQYWWASHNPCWHPLMVQKGAEMLRDVVQKIDKIDRKEKDRANQLYQSIIETGKKLYGDEIVAC